MNVWVAATASNFLALAAVALPAVVAGVSAAAAGAIGGLVMACVGVCVGVCAVCCPYETPTHAVNNMAATFFIMLIPFLIVVAPAKNIFSAVRRNS